MRDPSTVYLDWEVELAPDVTLEPNVILRGPTSVGDGSVIGAGSQLIDATIGERATRVGQHRRVVGHRGRGERRAVQPPATRQRRRARGAQVGNFAELKNTRLGAGSKQHHVSYLGDAEVGERVNIGAGTITANYDGTRKHPTTDRRRGVPGRRHDARRADRGGRGRQDRRRRRGHRDVPPGKLAVGVPARIREPGAPPTTRGGPAAGDPPAKATPVKFPVVELLIIVFLTFLEGFFVAAEIALVSIRRSRVEQLVEEGKPGARRVRRLLDEPGRFLAVCQLGLTVIGFFASAFAAVSLSTQLTTVLRRRPAWRRVPPRAVPRGRDGPPGAVHDRLRRARAEDARRSPTPERFAITLSAADRRSWPGRSARSSPR